MILKLAMPLASPARLDDKYRAGDKISRNKKGSLRGLTDDTPRTTKSRAMLTLVPTATSKDRPPLFPTDEIIPPRLPVLIHVA